MSIAVNATKEALADAYVALGSWISLHTANPGTTGASEATGGSYARKQTTWATGDASDGVNTGSQVEIDVPPGTYTHVGIFNAATGGTFVDFYDIPTDIVMGSAGKIRVTPTYTQA